MGEDESAQKERANDLRKEIEEIRKGAVRPQTPRDFTQPRRPISDKPEGERPPSD